MNNQLISILMSLQNEQKFLPECLDSIVNQSISNWELIAVDDHSSDTTLDILKGFAKRDSRIRVFTNPGKGIISALKKSFSESKGDYITRMDGDDIMPGKKLSSLFNTLKEQPETVVTGLVEYFSESEVKKGFREYANWLNQLTLNNNHWNDIYKECVITSPCWMMHRTDLVRIGAFDYDDYPEDYDLCFRMYFQGLKVHGIPEQLHLWRDHPDRASRNSVHYADSHFYKIKIRYFLLKEITDNSTIVLWSAGAKAKMIGKILTDQGIHFQWLCNNPKKIGQHIYQTEIRYYKDLQHITNAKVIVPIAQEEFLVEIEDYFSQLKLKKNRDYFIMG